MAETNSTPQDVSVVSCQQRYERLRTEREPYLRRAREAAVLTIPALMPPEGHSGSTELTTPFQSCGAEGVNSLASKLLLAMLPPQTSFFRLEMEPKEREKLVAAGLASKQDIVGEIDVALGKMERAVHSRLEQVGARISTFDAMKHLLVCGNALIQVLDKGAMRLHYLNNYVVKRDPSGNVLEIIIHEKIAKDALPLSAQALLAELPEDEQKDTSVNVYTRVYRLDGMYHVYQEISGKTVPGSEGTYPLDKSAFIPLRYVKIDGQDYGRGRVEEYIGDFYSLESLSQSIVEGTAMAAKVLLLVSEAGVTSKKQIQDAPNGAIIDGDIKDVGILKLDKYADFSIALQKEAKLESRLNKAFLVAQQREAERVTRAEVISVIEELEKTLGGVYAVLSQEFQLPVVRRIMAQMQRDGSLPSVPEKLIAPKIITGLEALGRNADFEKLRMFVTDLGQEFGHEAVVEYINVGAYARRKGAALQIDLEGIVRSEQEVQQSREARAQQEMVNKLGPASLKNETDQAKLAQSAPAAEAA